MKNSKNIYSRLYKLSLILILVVIVVFFTVWIFFIKPLKDEISQYSTMKSLAVIIAIYGEENHFYPSMCDELTKYMPMQFDCGENENFENIYCIGGNKSEDGNLPIIIIEKADSNWFYNKILGYPQKRHIGLANGTVRRLVISPDADGLNAVLEAAISTYPELFMKQDEVDLMRQRILRIDKK